MNDIGKRNGFFLSGYYGNNNFGDDLMLETVIDKISEANENAYFYIRNNQKMYFLKNNYSNYEETNLDRLLFQENKSPLIKIISFTKKYLHYIKMCRYLVFGGGTVVHDNNGTGSLIIMLIMILLARLYRLRIYFIGIGVKPLNTKISKLLLRIILLFSDEFNVRDKASLEYLNTFISADKKVNLTADIVYSNLRLAGYQEDINNKQRVKCIGFALNGNFFDSNDSNPIGKIDRVEQKIKDILNEGYSIRLYILSPTDKDISLEICRRINDNRVSTTVLGVEGDIIDQFEGIDAMVSMRFHALVLSTIREVPICGINIDAKISDLCNYFEALVINNWTDFHLNELLAEYTEEKKQVLYTNKVQELREQSNRGFSFLKKI